MDHTRIFLDCKPVPKSESTGVEIPFFPVPISAGFPSPAGDFTAMTIDLNLSLIEHPSATYFGKVGGESMVNAGIFDGDLVIVDKSLPVAHGSIAVCYIDGEFTIKRIKLEKDECWLMPENDKYKPIKIDKENDFMIWGVVAYTIKSFLKCTPW